MNDEAAGLFMFWALMATFLFAVEVIVPLGDRLEAAMAMIPAIVGFHGSFAQLTGLALFIASSCGWLLLCVAWGLPESPSR